MSPSLPWDCWSGFSRTISVPLFIRIDPIGNCDLENPNQRIFDLSEKYSPQLWEHWSCHQWAIIICDLFDQGVAKSLSSVLYMDQGQPSFATSPSSLRSTLNCHIEPSDCLLIRVKASSFIPWLHYPMSSFITLSNCVIEPHHRSID